MLIEKRIAHFGSSAIIMVALILCFFSFGCGTCRKGLHPYEGVDPIKEGQANFETTLQVQFLSVGGFVFQRADDVVVTPPFYSNPSSFRTLLGRNISSDTNLVEQMLPRRIPGATAILVGHAHYDHLMDLPYIANNRLTNAAIYGSRTTFNILSAVVSTSRLHSVEEAAGEFKAHGKPGCWVTNGNMRFMPLKSEHSPHFGPIKLFKGEVPPGQTELPRSAYGWKEGRTLAYIVDFLKANGEIEYRIVYHDSAVNYPKFGGLPEIGEKRPPDVLIVCMGSSGNVSNYPEGLITELKPKNIIVSHWDNFFKPLPSHKCATEALAAPNPTKFLGRIAAASSGTPVYLPAPGALMTFRSAK